MTLSNMVKKNIYIYDNRNLNNKYQLLFTYFIINYLCLGKIFDKYDTSQSFQLNVQSLERIIDPKSSSSSSSSNTSIKSILRPSSPTTSLHYSSSSSSSSSSSREDSNQLPSELLFSPAKVVPGRKNVMFNDDGDMIIKTPNPNEKTPNELSSPYDRSN